ncbi:RNA binding protein, partial [Metarhizium majus ARSEF 297]
MKSKRVREAATAAEDFLLVDDAPVEKKRKRSDDEPAEVKHKKAKKAKKDKKDKKKDKKESRKERKDKRKDLQDLPEEEKEEEEDAAKDDADVSQTPDVSDEKKSKKKEKKEKKRKEAANGDVSDEPKKEKKDKKKKSKDEAAPTQETPAPAASNDAEGAPDAKSSRHIVFVGNLPFTATADSIKAHFASLKPISVRCMKNKDDDKPCRGIAFVEFANVWTMRTCLDKFHHTEFEGRRINVELTAGGGGKTKFRKDKIREKNQKLDENRAKRIERERAAKEESGGQREEGSAGIHPSRLARVPGLGE